MSWIFGAPMMSMRDRLICGRMMRRTRVSRLVRLRKRKKKRKLLRAKWKRPKALVRRQRKKR